MYVSHPVRRVRDDPNADETVSLVVEPVGEDADAIESAVAGHGGTVERRLQLGSLKVRVPEPAVSDLCERDDIARIETANTLGLGLNEE